MLLEVSFEETRLETKLIKSCPRNQTGEMLSIEDVPISIDLIRNGELKMSAKTKLLISLLPCQQF